MGRYFMTCATVKFFSGYVGVFLRKLLRIRMFCPFSDISQLVRIRACHLMIWIGVRSQLCYYIDADGHGRQ